MVRDYRQRFQGGLRQTTLVPREHVRLHLVVVCGMRKQPPATRNLAQLDAPVRVRVVGAERAQGRLRLLLVRLRGLRELACGHGIGGNQQQRLKYALERALVYGRNLTH